MKNLTVNMPLAVPHQRPPSKYASHPYPALIDEDAYQPTVQPLDITLTYVYVPEEHYIATAKPLDIALRTILMRKDIDDGDAHKPSVRALDMGIYTQQPKIYDTVVSVDAINTTATAFDITIRRLLLVHENLRGDAFSPTAKALNISKTTEV